MDRWNQSIHEFIVIAWLPQFQCWSISWHSGFRESIEHEFTVKISEAILKIEDWMRWRSETLNDCWLPDSWSLALLDGWSRAATSDNGPATPALVLNRDYGKSVYQLDSRT